jgi:hypothetical protein
LVAVEAVYIVIFDGARLDLGSLLDTIKAKAFS